MNHDQIRHLRSLRLLLSQDKARLAFSLQQVVLCLLKSHEILCLQIWRV